MALARLGPGDHAGAGAASGGVWVSHDAGSTFGPAWPADATQAIGAVATAPDGAVYAGTGEVNPGGGSLTYTGPTPVTSTSPASPC